MRISHGRRGRPGLSLGALEVAIGLQERLLGQILGVVMVADAVVGIAVDIAQMSPIELGELGVELRLGLGAVALGHSCNPTPAAAADQAARETSRPGSWTHRREAGAPARRPATPTAASHTPTRAR